MVRAGVPLPEIGQVLRHRGISTPPADLRQSGRRPAPASGEALACGRPPMSDLARHVEDYLRLVRGRWASSSEGKARFCLSSLRTSNPQGRRRSRWSWAVAWARLPKGVQPIRWAHRLSAARGFATHLKTIDLKTDMVPPPDVLVAASTRRPTPYPGPTPTSGACWKPRDGSSRRCAPRRMRPSSAFSPWRACESVKRSVCNEMTPTLVRDCLRSGGEGLFAHRLVPLHPSATEATLRSLSRPAVTGCAQRRSQKPSSSPATGRQKSSPAACARHSSRSAHRSKGCAQCPCGHAFTSCALVSPSTRLSNGTDLAITLKKHMAVLSTYLGHVNPAGTYWYLSASPELMELATARLDGRFRSTAMKCARSHTRGHSSPRGLANQRRASPHTIAAYRDTFRLLLRFVADRTRASQPRRAGHRRARRAARGRVLGSPRMRPGTTKSEVETTDLLPSTRCLATPRYATPSTPDSIQRVLAIPTKRCPTQHHVTYLTDKEVDAMISAC